jgi:hypothetical protein
VLRSRLTLTAQVSSVEQPCGPSGHVANPRKQACGRLGQSGEPRPAFSGLFGGLPVPAFGDAGEWAHHPKDLALVRDATQAKLGGSLENAALMANHASTRTTQLYDRRSDDVTLDEVERIIF